MRLIAPAQHRPVDIVMKRNVAFVICQGAVCLRVDLAVGRRSDATWMNWGIMECQQEVDFWMRQFRGSRASLAPELLVF